LDLNKSPAEGFMAEACKDVICWQRLLVTLPTPNTKFTTPSTKSGNQNSTITPASST